MSKSKIQLKHFSEFREQRMFLIAITLLKELIDFPYFLSEDQYPFLHAALHCKH